MKLIILSAFNGRLKSEPMEWPNLDDHIIFPVAKSVPHRYDFGKTVMGPEQEFKKACFERTNKVVALPNLRTAIIYELVEFPF